MRPMTAVVGAGAGGLTAALYLQQAGHDVVLVEAKPRVGGCASAFPLQGFRFLAGATTLIGLEPDMPLGQVLRELGLTFTAPTARPNLTVWQHGAPLTLSTDEAANREALAARHGAALARFWDEGVALGRQAWQLLRHVHVPPRGPADFLGVARQGTAWRLLPALTRTTGQALAARGLTRPDVCALVDGLLLVSTQAGASEVPHLFGALGLEYLTRPLYLADGGLAGLLEAMAQAFVRRRGTLKLETRATGLARRGAGFRVDTSAGPLDVQHVVLNLTHWDAARLVDASLARPAGFAAEVRRHPEAWAACTLYAGVPDVFSDGVAPYHQVLLEAPLPTAQSHSCFVTLSRRGDEASAPPGHRALTVSCHTPAAAWEGLSEEEARRRKAAVTAELAEQLGHLFPALRGVAWPVTLGGTPRTWEDFTGRHGGRVGGLPLTVRTLLGWYPTGRTGVPGLWRVGDTIFPGQSVPACAWGARRVVEELLATSGDSRRKVPLAAVSG